MWTKERGHEQPPPATPPAPTGDRLATFPRTNGAEELRVSLDAYEGHKYVAVRLWTRGSDGAWWPTKRGCSIRLGEVVELAEALRRLADELGLAGSVAPGPRREQAPPDRDDRPQYVDRRRRPGRYAPTTAPTLPDPRGGFSEFTEE